MRRNNNYVPYQQVLAAVGEYMLSQGDKDLNGVRWAMAERFNFRDQHGIHLDCTGPISGQVYRALEALVKEEKLVKRTTGSKGQLHYYTPEAFAQYQDHMNKVAAQRAATDMRWAQVRQDLEASGFKVTTVSSGWGSAQSPAVTTDLEGWERITRMLAWHKAMADQANGVGWPG